MHNQAETILTWIRSLESTRIPLVQREVSARTPFHSIDLAVLTKDIESFSDVHQWWKSKNMTPHLMKNITTSILATNPPEEVKNIFLLLML